MSKKTGGVAGSYVDSFFVKSDEVAAEGAKLQPKEVFRGALKDVRSLLEYAKTLGMTEVNRSPSPLPSPLRGEGRVRGGKTKALKQLRQEIVCNRCRLCNGRTNIVFGTGNPDARLMFIGEGPGEEEDRQGIPFVGRAGQLLTKIIEAMGYKRDEVYITNVVKCRPPNNRNPEPDEVAACIPYLIRQVEIIRPKVIVCLGSVATQNLLGTDAKITGMRGKFTSWQGIPVMPTYHPAFLLRNPNMKKPVWEDMQKVMKFLAQNS